MQFIQYNIHRPFAYSIGPIKMINIVTFELLSLYIIIFNIAVSRYIIYNRKHNNTNLDFTKQRKYIK